MLTSDESYQGVIFDCDGVLLDTERLHAHVFTSVLNELGVSLDVIDVQARLRGLSLANCYAYIESNFDVTVDAGFKKTMAHASKVAYQQGIRPVPGIDRVLSACRLRQIPMAVASNGHVDRVKQQLCEVGFWSYFEERVFGIDDVPCGKPAPDIYRLAARQFSQTPICVIEDSLTGVQAARAAGLTVFWLTSDKVAETQEGVKSIQHPCEILPYLRVR